MLLNGYLMQRATLQRDYNEKSSEFVSLVPSTQISDLSEHLLSSKIHTFHEENTKKINIKQKELQDLQMNTKETRIEQKGKEDKEEEVDVSEVDIDVEEESDIDVGEEGEREEKVEEEEVEDQEGGYGDHSNIKVINFTKEAMEGGKEEKKTLKQVGGDDLPTLLQDGGDDLPTLLQDGGEELPTLLQEGGEPSNAEQIGGEVGTAVKNVVVSFF